MSTVASVHSVAWYETDYSSSTMSDWDHSGETVECTTAWCPSVSSKCDWFWSKLLVARAGNAVNSKVDCSVCVVHKGKSKVDGETMPVETTVSSRGKKTGSGQASLVHGVRIHAARLRYWLKFAPYGVDRLVCHSEHSMDR